MTKNRRWLDTEQERNTARGREKCLKYSQDRSSQMIQDGDQRPSERCIPFRDFLTFSRGQPEPTTALIYLHLLWLISFTEAKTGTSSTALVLNKLHVALNDVASQCFICPSNYSLCVCPWLGQTVIIQQRSGSLQEDVPLLWLLLTNQSRVTKL